MGGMGAECQGYLIHKCPHAVRHIYSPLLYSTILVVEHVFFLH